jgi:hypothetical protein
MSIIWPGLDHIVRAFLTREMAGESLTAYPFRIQPLPPGFDSGNFSPSMADRIRRLWAKLQPLLKTGGRVRMDSFELRAAVLSARITLTLERVLVRKARKRGTRTKVRLPPSKKAMQKLEQRKRSVIETLERYMKRANRRFLAQASRNEFKALSKEWQSHLRWIRFHLAYFKPFRPSGPGLRKRQRETIDRLVKMATLAIEDQGFELPDPGELRHVIRLFVRYSRRGRRDLKHHRYMLANKDRFFARDELFRFLKPRLEFGGDVKKSGGKTSRIAHRLVALRPEVDVLIKEIRKNWDDWTSDERTEHLSVLTSKGCTIRGLATDLGIPESTLRRYSKPSTSRLEKSDPRSDAPAQKSPAQKAGPERPRETEGDHSAKE